MSGRSLALQQAVWTKVTDLLAAADGSGGPVPVFDHAPPQQTGLFSRLDGFRAVPIGTRTKAVYRHSFYGHVFDRPAGKPSRSRGLAEAQRVLDLLVPGLRHWSPFPGEGRIEVVFSETSIDQDGVTPHGLAHFTLVLGEA